MKFLKDKGFVIKRVSFGESDRFITLYTQNNGKIELVAKGVKKITSRRSSHIEPFNILSFQAVHGHKDYILTEVELVKSSSSLKKTLEGYASVFRMCELIERLCPYGERNTQVFDVVMSLLDEQDSRSIEEKMFIAQTQLLSSLGYWDSRKTFISATALTRFIENIMERQMKTDQFFSI